MMSCEDVVIYWTRCVFSDLSACLVAVVTAFTVAAKYSFCAFVSHVTLLSTPVACWSISVVWRVWRIAE